MGDAGAPDEQEPGPRQGRRRSRRRIAAAVVVVAVLVPLLYLFVIPRTEVVVRVHYNESVLNQINIDPQISNPGTNEATAVTLRIAVVNSTDAEMGKREYTVARIAQVFGVAKLDALTFRGDQYEKYTIIIDIELSAGGQTHKRHWSHSTAEPWLNQDWTDRVS
ncbi:MAG: hypothetical protein FJ149_11225 [Euryarchaeota archaeon]|nr:hypothetical protein [Euryarchaeota archaeon]